MRTLIGPFRQILTMNQLPLYGPINDAELEIIPEGGIITDNGKIQQTGSFESLRKDKEIDVEDLEGEFIVMPGLIDSHTHICFAGTRSEEYAMKIAGKSYQEILEAGGGIYRTVENTRKSTEKELYSLTRDRIIRHLKDGVTTVEIKSGYGLSYEDELKMLRVIADLKKISISDIVPTCLAAHVKPPEFKTDSEYLEFILEKLLPEVAQEQLADRVDIFIEKNAFGIEESLDFLLKARQLNFRLTVHADQFTSGGSEVACAARAVSADHLESVSDKNINNLAENDVVATVLPGASLGLGMPFARARDILDAGCCLAIASDWNPGSAPMGDLLVQAAILSAAQKLSNAEIFAALTFRAAKALSLSDRGRLINGQIADMTAFRTSDYREILYNQGMLKPEIVWKNGKRITNKL